MEKRAPNSEHGETQTSAELWKPPSTSNMEAARPLKRRYETIYRAYLLSHRRTKKYEPRDGMSAGHHLF